MTSLWAKAYLNILKNVKKKLKRKQRQESIIDVKLI